MLSLFLSVTAASNGDVSGGDFYPQSTAFGPLINPGISPLRPTDEFYMITEMVNTANYINTQRQNAEEAVQNMQSMVPGSVDGAASAVVAPPGYTDSYKIDLTEAAGYHNQAILETVNYNFYTGEHLLRDTYSESKDELDRQIEIFTAAATEISKTEMLYEQALMSETEEQRVAIQQYIRANDTQLDNSTITLYNESLDRIEDSAQLAAASLFASQDPVALGIINTDSIASLSNIVNSTVEYDAWSDELTVTWDNTTENTVIQGMFFNNESEVQWTSVTPVYDGFYEDMPTMGSLFSSYTYGAGEAIANTTTGYNPNAKLYDAAQLQMDLIAISNTGTTQLNSETGALGGEVQGGDE